jgi:hypothetical protein
MNETICSEAGNELLVAEAHHLFGGRAAEPIFRYQ